MSSAGTELLERLDSREEDWRRELLGLYDQGASDREVMRALDLTPAQWKILEQSAYDTGFAEAVSIGRVMRHAWWEAQGRIHLFNPKFNTALYKTMMSNNFGWSDKTVESMTELDFTNMDSDGLIRKISQLNERLDASRKETTTL